jgi:hypothetical protein
MEMVIYKYSIVILLLFNLFVYSEVTVKNSTTSINQHPVLECTTVTENGVLLWAIPGGGHKLYSLPTTIDLAPSNIDDIFETRLVEIGTNVDGKILRSTATIINPVKNISVERNLTCYDGLFGTANASTALIIYDTSPPIDVQHFVINSTCINICWSHPNYVVASVTGYYINHTSNGTSQIIPLTSTNTNDTMPVIPYTYNIFTVIATNGLINRSSSQTYVDIYGPEVMKFVYYINDDDINNTTNNTGHVTLLVSWEYTPNRPPVVNQTLSLDGTHNVNVPIGERSWLFTKVNDSNDHSLSLTADNVIDFTRKGI